ncbi:hypothetical protein AAKU58_003947 [Oxalobacteraceae bacterium GrIS 1.18]
MARPGKNDEEKLVKTVAFRLTELDYKKYQAKFLASGLTQSEFFREHVLTNTTTVTPKKQISQDATKAIFLLQKTSNNINQLARVANTEHLAKKISNETFLSIIHQLEDISQSLNDLVDKVKK